MNTVYTISDAWDGGLICTAGFVTDKRHCDLLALRDYFDQVCELEVTVTVEGDTVIVRDEDGTAQTYYIQTIKRLV